MKEPTPACRIAAVGRAAGFLVHAGGDDDERRAGEICIVAVMDMDSWGQGCAVAKIGSDAFRALAVSVHHDDLTRATAHYGR
jgi:hypothetical protein